MSRSHRGLRAGLLLVLLVAMRGATWFTPLADPTIGLYLHVGRALAYGTLPYVAAWDFRPPGLFALYAIGYALAREQAANVLATFSLAATALALGLLATRLDPEGEAATGWIAATAFTLLSGVDDALAGAAEVEIGAFAAWAFLAAGRAGGGVGSAALAGLLAGGALQCKLSAAPLVAVVFGALLARPARVARGAAFAAGALAPVAVEALAYARASALDLLWNANIGALAHRARIPASGEFDRNRGMALAQIMRLAPALELAPFAALTRGKRPWLALGWWTAAALSIALTGEYFERQFVLLAAPTALLGALGFAALSRRLHAMPRIRTVALAVLALGTFALHGLHDATQGIAYAGHRLLARDRTWRADGTERVRAAIACAARDDPSLFVIALSPYLYDLTGARVPTRYPYTDHLLDPILSRVAAIDGRAELARILRARPHTIVTGDLGDYRYSPQRVADVRRALARDYTVAIEGRGFAAYRLHGRTTGACGPAGRSRTADP